MVSKGCMKHLKQGWSQKVVKSSSPKRLWDNCIETEVFIFLNNALDIYGLEGQLPETVMTVKTADISNLCKYEWFQCMMYYQPKEGYPNDKMAIGKYLGPAIDVGNTMTYKILLPDGNYVCRLTVRPWTTAKEANHVLLVYYENICPKYRRR